MTGSDQIANQVRTLDDLNWESEDTFSIDGVKIQLEKRPPSERRISTENHFTLVKPKAFLKVYFELLPHNPRSILDVGIFQGGSVVLFDLLFKPDRLAGVDVSKQEIAPLMSYLADKPDKHAFFGTSQGDRDAMTDILETCFPDGVDLVVDDASHQLELSRETFNLCFPHVTPGGLYVLEDWSWSLNPKRQSQGALWFDEPSLVNLVIDLQLSVAVSSHIEWIKVYPFLVLVKKKEIAREGVPDGLPDLAAHLRGRAMYDL